MARSGQQKLFIHAQGARWRWLVTGATGSEASSGDCDPQQPNWPRNLPVHLLCDAALCTPLTVDLPQLSAARMEQALRWAAEEHLAGSAEDEHVVAGGRIADGRVRCLVIAQFDMHELLEPLEDQVVEQVCPDALCLPWSDGTPGLGESNGQVLARWGEWEFGSFEAELAVDLLDGVADRKAEWRWFGGTIPESLADRVRPASGTGLLESLAPQAASAPINLLSGRWAPGSARAAARNWQWVAGLAGLVLLVALAGLVLENHMLQARSEALQSAMDERFAAAFPGLSPAGRHRELAERELARLRFGQSAGLLEMMYRAAPVLAGQDGVFLDGLSYRDDSLEVRVRAPDVAALDELERRLRALDLSASVQSASLDGDGASGRIRIGGRTR